MPYLGIKYLGHFIENDLSDDRDINREIKSLYTRTNILIRRFSRCSIGVKIKLFKMFKKVYAYMMLLYGRNIL